MTNEEYRKRKGISRSELFKLSKSPLHFKYAKEHPAESTPALIFGAAAHKFILEPETFYEEYAVAPIVDKRTKEGKAAYEEFCSDSEGKTVISSADFDTIVQMSNAIDDNPTARRFLTGECEQSFFWTDSETGESVKCRPDCLTEIDGKKYIVDYKTTDSCADGHFERNCKKYGYKLQAGMYREGMFQNTFDDYGFVFVAQEKSAPFAVRVYICSPAFIDEGYDEYRALLGLYHYCKVNDRWYGYEGIDNDVSILEGEQ